VQFVVNRNWREDFLFHSGPVLSNGLVVRGSLYPVKTRGKRATNKKRGLITSHLRGDAGRVEGEKKTGQSRLQLLQAPVEGRLSCGGGKRESG